MVRKLPGQKLSNKRGGKESERREGSEKKEGKEEEKEVRGGK